MIFSQTYTDTLFLYINSMSCCSSHFPPRGINRFYYFTLEHSDIHVKRFYALLQIQMALDCHVSNPFIYLLVCQHRVALKWRQVAVKQGSAGSVMLTEDCTIDVVEAISRHQPVSTGGTTETLQEKKKIKKL